MNAIVFIDRRQTIGFYVTSIYILPSVATMKVTIHEGYEKIYA